MEATRTLSLTESTAAVVERKRRGGIRLTSAKNKSHAIPITLAVLFAITVYTFVRMDFGHADLNAAFPQAVSDFLVMIAQPALDPPLGAGHFTWQTLAGSVVVTVFVTLLTTAISSVASLFFGLAAAQNLSNPTVSNIVKGIIAVVRAIPTILWVLVFTVAIGIGAEAAVLGISFHSFAYLTKSYSESFEEIDEGTVEALRSSGASFWQIVFQAIIPATITELLSWTFIRLEINFANAVAVGAFAGAGGIGFQLYQAGSFYFNLHEVGVIVYICVIIALVLELVSTRLRRRLRVNE